MDLPPQVDRGVGHGPEYSTAVRTGQLSVTMWTVWTGRLQREPAVASVLAGPPRAASAAAYRSAGRTPLSAVTR